MKPLCLNHAPMDELRKEKEEKTCKELSSDKKELSKHSSQSKIERKESSSMCEELKLDKEFENFPKSTKIFEEKGKICKGKQANGELKEFSPEMKSETKEDITSDKLINTDEFCMIAAGQFFDTSNFFLYDEVPENVNSLELHLSGISNQSVKNDFNGNCTKLMEAVEEMSPSSDEHKIYCSHKSYHVGKKSKSQDNKCEDINRPTNCSGSQLNATIDLQKNNKKITLSSNECSMFIATDCREKSFSHNAASSKYVASTSSEQTEVEKALKKIPKTPSKVNRIKNNSSPTVVKNTRENHYRECKELISPVAKSKTNKMPNKHPNIISFFNGMCIRNPIVSLTDVLKGKNDMSYVNKNICTRSRDCTDFKDKNVKTKISLKQDKTNMSESKNIQHQPVTLQEQHKNSNQLPCNGSNNNTFSEISTSFQNEEMKRTLKIAAKFNTKQIRSKRNSLRENGFLEVTDFEKKNSPNNAKRHINKVKESVNEMPSINKDCSLEKTFGTSTQNSTPVMKQTVLNNLNPSNTFQKSKHSDAVSSISHQSSFMELFDKIRGSQPCETSILPIQMNYIQDFLVRGIKVDLKSPNKQTSKSLEIKSENESAPFSHLVADEPTPKRKKGKSKFSTNEEFKKKAISKTSFTDKSTPKKIKQFELREKASSKISVIDKFSPNINEENSMFSVDIASSEESIINKSTPKRIKANLDLMEKTYSESSVANKSTPKRYEDKSNLHVRGQFKDKTNSSKRSVAEKSTLEKKKINSKLIINKELRSKTSSGKNVSVSEKLMPVKENPNYKSSMNGNLENTLFEESFSDKSTPKRKKKSELNISEDIKDKSVSKVSINKELSGKVSKNNVVNKSTCERNMENSKLNTNNELGNRISPKASTSIARIVEVRSLNENVPLRRSSRIKKSPSFYFGSESTKSSVKNAAMSKKEPTLKNTPNSNPVNRLSSKSKRRKNLQKQDIPENMSIFLDNAVKESLLKAKKRSSASVECSFLSNISVPKKRRKTPFIENNNLSSGPKNKKKRRCNITSKDSDSDEFLESSDSENNNLNLTNSNSNLNAPLINQCSNFGNFKSLSLPIQGSQTKVPGYYSMMPVPPGSFMIFDHLDNLCQLASWQLINNVPALVSFATAAAAQNVAPAIANQNLTPAIVTQKFTPIPTIVTQKFTPINTTQNFSPITTQNFNPIAAQNFSPITMQNFSPITTQNFSPITTQNFSPVTTQNFNPITMQNFTPAIGSHFTAVPSQNLTSVVSQNTVPYTCFQPSINPNLYSTSQLNSNTFTKSQIPISDNSSSTNTSNVLKPVGGIPKSNPISKKVFRVMANKYTNMPATIADKDQHKNTKADKDQHKNTKADKDQHKNTKADKDQHKNTKADKQFCAVKYDWESIVNSSIYDYHRHGLFEYTYKKFSSYSVKEFCSLPDIFPNLIDYVNDDVLYGTLKLRVEYQFGDSSFNEPFSKILRDFVGFQMEIVYEGNTKLTAEELESGLIETVYEHCSYTVCHFFSLILNSISKKMTFKELASCLTLACIISIFCEVQKKQIKQGL